MKMKLSSVVLLAVFGLALLVCPALASPPGKDTKPAAADSQGVPAIAAVLANDDDQPGSGGVLALVAGLAAMLFAVSPAVKDALLKVTTALPNGAATVYSTGIDTGVTPAGTHQGDYEWVLTAPAMNATEMPDSKTMTYSILTDTVAPIDASSTVLMPSVIVQTGASGAGCAAATYRFKLPSNAGRIVGVRAVGSASGNATTASLTLEPVF
jgi:hypothetical protein